MARSALIAIGGNSLIRAGQRGTMLEQLANARSTAQRIAQFVAEGWKIVLTHGNGPHVGAALLRSERAAGEVYAQPLDVCVASTQSEIGYFLQLGLEHELKRVGMTMPVVALVTKVEVREGGAVAAAKTNSRAGSHSTDAQYGDFGHCSGWGRNSGSRQERSFAHGGG